MTEGERYKFGELRFEGNKVVRSEGLQSLYKIEPGEWYSPEEAAGRQQEGAGDLRRRRVHGVHLRSRCSPTATIRTVRNGRWPRKCPRRSPRSRPRRPLDRRRRRRPAPTVDITMRIDEGPQYFVNRITFTGNTTTRDNVIRREMRLVEGGIFNTEALKYSVRRLNQLGYFKELKGDDRDMKVDKTPGKENTVDVTLKFEEQNRNQLTFGAGVSQYEGLLRSARVPDLELPRAWREADVVAAGGRSGAELPARLHRAVPLRSQHHRRVRCLQPVAAIHRLLHAEVAGPEPGLWFPGRRLHAHVHELLVREGPDDRLERGALRHVVHPAADRMSTISSLKDLSQLTPTQIEVLRRNPFVYDSLLIGQGGERSVSKITPSLVHNTVDNPIFPNQGKRLTASIDLAVLGGNTQFYKPRGEAIFFFRHLPRTSVGFRALAEISRRSDGLNSCRSSSDCSSAVNTASAASTSGPSGRVCRDRSSCSVATRACCSTPSTSFPS